MKQSYDKVSAIIAKSEKKNQQDSVDADLQLEESLRDLP